MKPVWVLNGPNLGRLGVREPEIYGSATYDDLVKLCEAEAAALGLSVDVRQTDDEATMLAWLHAASEQAAAVVLNAAAWGHYSRALGDAVSMVTVPVVEVHLSNPYAREEFRHSSTVTGLVKGTIAGFGQDSYRLALVALAPLVPQT
ncbi:MAG: 3-dehydroquinate dehydratase [Frankiaceae bacterium]|jgi:3-dehydroquinate dehydratase-2|nr:3-dehydroquinate dehydratase [Frankiaceae bacterium]